MSRTMPRLELSVRPQNIYVAGSKNGIADCRKAALLLMRAGLWVTSTWLTSDDETPQLGTENWNQYARKWSETDLADVKKADTIFLDARWESTSGGYHFELGFFLGSGKNNVILVGPKKNIFFENKYVRQFGDIEPAVDWLKSEVRRFDAMKPPTIGEEDDE